MALSVPTLSSLARLTLAAACLATGLAQAGPLRASASLTSDPAGVVNVQSNTGSAFAAYPSTTAPVVTAFAGRRHLVIDSNAAGHSTAFTEKYGGSADVQTSYALWNLAENRALTADEAAAYTLSFNFNLTGVTTTGGTSHERSVGFGGQLTYAAFPFAVAFGDNAAFTQDPNGHVAVGNQALMGATIDEDYSLVHQGAAGGDVFFSLQALSTLDATAYYDLWLESVTLLPGQSLRVASFSSLAASDSVASNASFDLSMGLGVRLLGDDGELIVVVPTATTGEPNGVPEPATLALVLGGMALVARRRVRR